MKGIMKQEKEYVQLEKLESIPLFKDANEAMRGVNGVSIYSGSYYNIFNPSKGNTNIGSSTYSLNLEFEDPFKITNATRVYTGSGRAAYFYVYEYNINTATNLTYNINDDLLDKNSYKTMYNIRLSPQSYSVRHTDSEGGYYYTTAYEGQFEYVKISGWFWRDLEYKFKKENPTISFIKPNKCYIIKKDGKYYTINI